MPSHYQFSNWFYSSSQWKACKNEYLKSVGYLCERCLAKGMTRTAEEVHHKIRLTEANINDPTISLNFDNLEALCKECHQLEHTKRRYKVLPDGSVKIVGE